MKAEWVIIIAAWFVSFGLIFIIPKNKKRLAFVAFIFTQAITWLAGLIVVELHLLSYPVRSFADVNRTSFTYEYLAFPMANSIFVSFYPSFRSWLLKFLYYCLFATLMTIPEIIALKFTQLIHYIHWTWYLSWLSIFATFLLTKGFCIWFFKGLHMEAE